MYKLSNFFKQYGLYLAIFFLILLVPNLSFAQSVADTPAATIKPAGSDNAWTLYVFGSARVIQELFMSIKMLVAPDAGSTGFITLMYLVATVGFLVLAIAAGYDPSKNLIRMFTYFLVVWAIVFSTTKLKADLHIIDKVGNTAPEVVTGAPALIVIPASLVSQIGEYFQRSIETYFSIASPFKMTTGGQFNLFATMIADASKFRIKDQGLSRSLSSYAGDCIIPAIARGQFVGKETYIQSFGTAIINPGLPTVSTRTVAGAEALYRTTDLMDAYKSAASPAILTKYYPYNGGKKEDGVTPSGWQNNLGLSTPFMGSNTGNGDFGLVVPCSVAYQGIQADMQEHAQALLNASSNAFGAAGGNQLYSTLFTEALASASSSEGPASYIRQKALLAQVNGSFRDAAAMTGNNDVLQSLATVQAEQQQKSMMVAAFSVFNNMMGYMYTVLQAFLFGMAPIIILAMLVPGLGKSILVNYMQVLIWLALWSPLLGIVNYIITLFGQYDMSQAFQMSGGGLSGHNDGLITEKANNLIIAGQFLGTLVPMISWGIIKGAMAFTEFINHGIGSQFAAQAGATAATGNYSLNNASADNLSMNKFSTQMSSAVGSGPVQSTLGAGAVDLVSKAGGSGVEIAGVRANPQRQLSTALTELKQQAEGNVEKLSLAKAKGTTIQSMFDEHRSSGKSIKNDSALMSVLSKVDAIGKSEGYNNKIFDIGSGEKVSAAQIMDIVKGLNGGIDVKFGFPGGDKSPVNPSATVGGKISTSQKEAVDTAHFIQTGRGEGGGDGTNNNTTIGDAENLQKVKTTGASQDNGSKNSRTETYSSQQLIQAALETQKSLTKSYGKAANDVTSMNIGSSTDMEAVQAMIAKWNEQPHLNEAQFDEDMKKLTGKVNAITNAAGVTPDSVTAMDPNADRKRQEEIARNAAAGGAQAREGAAGLENPDIPEAEKRLRKEKKDMEKKHHDNMVDGAARANAVTKGIKQSGKDIHDTSLPQEAVNLLGKSKREQIVEAVEAGKPNSPAVRAELERVDRAKRSLDSFRGRGSSYRPKKSDPSNP